MAVAPQVRIVLDSDVVIHFIKGECLNRLPAIFSKYKFVILDIVYNRELSKDLASKRQIDNQINYLKNIEIIPWKPSLEMTKEFAILKQTKGIGESACLAYCKFHNDVLASSNLRDTKAYCQIDGAGMR